MLVGALFRHWSLRLFAPDLILRQTYEAFRTLLSRDIRSHELMAEFAEFYHEGKLEDFARIRYRYRLLTEAVAGMISALEQMHPGQVSSLRAYFNKYDFYCRLLLASPEQLLIPPFAVSHDEIVDAALVGQKSANLLVLKHAAKVRVPDGFTITTTTFFSLIEHNRLRPAIDLLLAGIDPKSATSLEETSQALMSLIRRMDVPEQIREALFFEYDRLAGLQPDPAPRMAVRSSALHEDGGHSFAGQYHSCLGITRDGLLTAYLEVLASKYTPQALSYRIHVGLSDEEAAMAVLVLVMIDAAASGVIYTRDPAFTDHGDPPLLIHSIYGLGLPLVGGETVPDIFSFLPHKATPAHMAAGCQNRRLVLRQGQLHEEPLPQKDGDSLSISRRQAVQLAAIGRELESFFGGAQDIEWAADAHQELFILQSRPLQVESLSQQHIEATVVLPDHIALLAGAKRAAGGVASGMVHHFDQTDREPIPSGTVLVTRHIPPSLVRYIGRLRAVVCEQGSVTGHFATVCREFGVALLVGATDALSLLPQGMEVTVDGFAGTVYQGSMAGLSDQRGNHEGSATSLSGKLQQLLDYITPLHLIDPGSENFRPQSCRSLHDIIRYAHETAVQTMFGLGDIAPGTSSRCKKLATDLPLDIYLLDVGGAFIDDAGSAVVPERLRAQPFLAIWQGLSHPEIDWQSHLHFDWKGFSDMALSGGIASGGSKEFASYAVVSTDYLNLNMRFGYHFTLVDCLCGEESRANYCQVRFAGGGGDYQGRSVRIALIRRILGRLGFEVNVRGDLLDARVSGYTSGDLCALLTELGRLLGMTKLLDMVVQEADIENYTQQFFQGAGRFVSAPEVPAPPEGR